MEGGVPLAGNIGRYLGLFLAVTFILHLFKEIERGTYYEEFLFPGFLKENQVELHGNEGTKQSIHDSIFGPISSTVKPEKEIESKKSKDPSSKKLCDCPRCAEPNHDNKDIITPNKCGKSKEGRHSTSRNFDFGIKYNNEKDATGPPGEYRVKSDGCPDDKPLCNTRVALLMTGHIRGALQDDRMASVKRFLAKCRDETSDCELFIHTWRYEQFLTKTWNTENPTLGPETDLTKLCTSLNCTTLYVERQDLHNIDVHKDWGFGGVSYEGARMVPYALYSINMQRKAHNARFGKSHDVIFRIRPDYYRTAHGDVLDPGKFRRCVMGIQPDTMYGVDRFIPGGSFPRNRMPNGQIRRPWNGNSGDNFFWARSDVFDKFIEYWMHNFEDVQKSTLPWNNLNPEADVGTVLERLSIKATTCR
eukprot:CAMPEP_0114517662 /NCGR_PEP_ID=MMETSP0109-20121206/18017_1 /TAXON_ID=29199 /ORGANISM="Chlorarachnion reptans, Strain CCCM449" /LENGTH=417 /DNA_ID=CAMNT_0001698205 /DNA_START=436 /DNA_END=1689 /DNA_ORIENTATION=-